ncbi:MAG: sulfite exporter TauE/SafE family protein [Burkholderiaceae bacterium]|nr:sulfite exporter TauE/SafE family protein [Burkholderiaceae bacterium]
MLFNLILGGVAAGFLAGMFGIGGGAIVIPVLIYIYKSGGMDATEAIRLAFGTSLATMAFTGLSSFLSHWQRDNVDFSWLKKLFLPAGLGATAGALLAARMPGAWLALGLSLMLAYFGLKLLAQREQTSSASPLFLRFHMLAGVLSGVAYSLAGMGGASVVTFYLCNVGLSLRKAIGTATGVILPISLGAIIGFGVTAGSPHDWRWGYIDLHALLVMGSCSVVASKLGVKAAAVLPTPALRKIFGVFMMGLAVKTVYTVLL